MNSLELSPQQEVKIRTWMSVFREKNESGETVRAFCERNGISTNAYYYWLRRIRKLALDELKERENSDFVKVPCLNPARSYNRESSDKVEIYLNSARIEIGESCSQELIGKILKGLKDA